QWEFHFCLSLLLSSFGFKGDGVKRGSRVGVGLGAGFTTSKKYVLPRYSTGLSSYWWKKVVSCPSESFIIFSSFPRHMSFSSTASLKTQTFRWCFQTVRNVLERSLQGSGTGVG